MPVINGTIGKDNPLRGTAGNDSIYGFAGDDRIITDDGDDYVEAGDGDDQVNGYPTTGTAYSFYASTGSKTFYGGNGNDFLFGSSGINLIYGDSGNDQIYGQDANDKLYGGEGNDEIYGGGGEDLLDGGSGDDYLSKYTEKGSGIFSGGPGNDTILGGIGGDSINGGEGDDPRLQGYQGNDVINGNSGNDKLYGDEGNDILDGGEGNDNLWDQSSGNDTLIGGEGNDYLSTYESSGDDKLYGGKGNDELLGGNGNDILDGGEGDDEIKDYVGNDTLIGGDGNDYLSTYGNVGDGKLYGEKGNDELLGGKGNDILDGGEGIDELNGYEGNDTYYVRDAYDYIYDSAGTDTAYVSASFVKIPSTIENVIYTDGAMELPYWISALIDDGGSGQKYQTLIGTSKTWFFAFPTTLPSYDTDLDHAKGFVPFNSNQISQTQVALDYISTVVDLKFIKTTVTAAANTLSFGSNVQINSGGYAQYPSESFTGSDIFLNNKDYNVTLADGTYGANVLMHELGHAFGLKHPFDEPDTEGDIPSAPYLQGSEDSSAWTYMSYNNSTSDYQIRYSPLDIAALQYIYGPSKSSRIADDVYVLSNYESNFIWDGAGTDTIDASKLTAGGTIYLTPGFWGYVGSKKASLITSPGQFTVNFGTSIENLIGSSYADALYGNELDNDINGGSGDDQISGLMGNDSINGGSGNDYLIGGEGNDRFDWNSSLRLGDDSFVGGMGDDIYVLNSKSDLVIENLNEGVDLVYVGFDYSLEKSNIEKIYTFSDQKTGVTFTGNSSPNTLRGSGFNDHLFGLDGTDYLYGNEGDDHLTGGGANDYLDGGVGVDFCLYQYTSTNYTVRYSDTAKKYYIASKTGAEGIDTFNSIERLTFSNLSLALDIDGNAGMVTKVLGSVFGKLAVKNPIFVGIGLSYADKGMTFSDLGSLALNAVGATTNDLIVSTLWKNVVGSDPSISDKTPYLKMLQDGIKPGQLVELAANTLLNTTNINLIGLAQTGIEYIPVS